MRRNTGKKVIVQRVCFSLSKDRKVSFAQTFECPNCYSKLKKGMNFCYECSQRLDWSEV